MIRIEIYEEYSVIFPCIVKTTLPVGSFQNISFSIFIFLDEFVSNIM